MRLKHIKNADQIIASSPFIVTEPWEYKGKWKEVFGNDNPIELEIGTGKGKFIIGKATANPGINYIGMEKYDSPLVSAVKKLEEANLPNLKLICFDALGIENIFDKEIDKVYLNFSDPWPQNGYSAEEIDTNHFADFRTEYEDKFISLGKNINYVRVVKE